MFAKVHLSDALYSFILPYIGQRRAFLEVPAACVVHEVVILNIFTQTAQMVRHEGGKETLFLNTLYNFILPSIVHSTTEVLEVCLSCMLLEVGSLSKIANVAQNLTGRRLLGAMF